MNRRELVKFGGAIVLASNWKIPGPAFEMRQLTGLQRAMMSPEERRQWRFVPEQKLNFNLDVAIYVREVWET